MTINEIIAGLQFTVEMFLFDPSTGETYTEPRNDMDKTTIDACKGAIELLEQQPCDDCISRKAVEKIINKWLSHPDYELKDSIYDMTKKIHKLPSVTPRQKIGHWINAYPDIEPNPMLMYGICSVCGFEQSISDKLNYCPNCGAKMEEE